MAEQDPVIKPTETAAPKKTTKKKSTKKPAAKKTTTKKKTTKEVILEKVAEKVEEHADEVAQKIADEVKEELTEKLAKNVKTNDEIVAAPGMSVTKKIGVAVGSTLSLALINFVSGDGLVNLITAIVRIVVGG